MRPQLSKEDYAQINNFLETQCGIRLGAGKEYLVSSRLGRLLEPHGLESFADLAKQLNRPGARTLQGAVIDAMTTNETFWFRDAAHFRLLIDSIAKEFTSGLRIWSAASSSGQEAYSIAMTINDAKRASKLGPTFRYEILGTDISPSMLQQAREAKYCGLAASRGLTEDQRQTYFEKDGDCLVVSPKYRQGVSFRDLNLTKSFDGLGRFDVVFCRNVLIYFSSDLKRNIIERIAKILNPGGYLLLGSTESMSEHTDLFEMHNLQGGLAYRRR